MNQEHENLLKIKAYWNEQAAQFHGKSLATTPDSIAFNLELQELIKHVTDGVSVLDVGCGNGIKGIELAKRIGCSYVGVDYAETMVKDAKAMLQQEQHMLRGDVQFLHGDILSENFVTREMFDVVTTARCLINLGSLENQVIAVKKMHSLLKSSGMYLMFENSFQPLENINAVRKEFALSPIEVRWHNNYIDEMAFFPLIKQHFSLVATVNYASTYFLISRTLNALLTLPGGEIDYMSTLNHLAARLPPLGDYAPAKLFVLQKIG